MKTAEVWLMPGAYVAATRDNIQGTFQLCRHTGHGIMNVTDENGCYTINIDSDLANALLKEFVAPHGPVTA